MELSDVRCDGSVGILIHMCTFAFMCDFTIYDGIYLYLFIEQRKKNPAR